VLAGTEGIRPGRRRAGDGTGGPGRRNPDGSGFCRISRGRRPATAGGPARASPRKRHGRGRGGRRRTFRGRRRPARGRPRPPPPRWRRAPR